MKAYSANQVQLYDRSQYREVLSRHPHIGLVNILGTTLHGVSEAL